jgi:uncharacterized protein YndB with AHSA1/START domain
MKTTDTKNSTGITKDLKHKSITVTREFDAPVEKVWKAFTASEMLDKWWGPQPWRAETKTMNFKPGGYWLYAMVSPENQRQWGRFNYLAIKQFEKIEVEDLFCDENGKVTSDLPASKGDIVFSKTKNGTRVSFKAIYKKESDVEKIIAMGFEEGISICFDQLENLVK